MGDPEYDFDHLQVEPDGPIRTVTLNNPDQMNAFSDAMHDEFAALWSRMAVDSGARAVVLTGAGRAFSAGGSIDEFEYYRTDFAARRKTLRNARRLVDDMLNLHLPVVAAVNGPAVGLGCTLASLCDIVFVDESTFFADPHVTVALVAGDGSAVTWPFMTSMLRVKQYLLTGDRIPAPTAVELGLANFAVPADALLPEATAFALRLAELPPQAVQDTKAVLNQVLRQAAVNVLGFGLAAESQSHDTEEYRAIPEKFHSRSRSR
jgi:enoyl-CoA hydratase/carnithine racemase